MNVVCVVKMLRWLALAAVISVAFSEDAAETSKSEVAAPEVVQETAESHYPKYGRRHEDRDRPHGHYRLIEPVELHMPRHHEQIHQEQIHHEPHHGHREPHHGHHEPPHGHHEPRHHEPVHHEPRHPEPIHHEPRKKEEEHLFEPEGQHEPRRGHREPGHNEPGHHEPHHGHREPGHNEPGHHEPHHGHREPGHNEPGHHEPHHGHREPGHNEPGHHEPHHGHREPGHNEPGHHEPHHGHREPHKKEEHLYKPEDHHQGDGEHDHRGSSVAKIFDPTNMVHHSPKSVAIIEDAFSPDYIQPTWFLDYRYVKTGNRDYAIADGGQVMILPEHVKNHEPKEFGSFDELLEFSRLKKLAEKNAHLLHPEKGHGLGYMRSHEDRMEQMRARMVHEQERHREHLRGHYEH